MRRALEGARAVLFQSGLPPQYFTASSVLILVPSNDPSLFVTISFTKRDVLSQEVPLVLDIVTRSPSFGVLEKNCFSGSILVKTTKSFGYCLADTNAVVASKSATRKIADVEEDKKDGRIVINDFIFYEVGITISLSFR